MKARFLSALAMVAATAAAFSIGCGGGGDAGSRTLHVFVWSGYLVPEIKDQFEKETGVHVAESNFENNEEMRAKLLAGDSGFDLVCPSDYAVTLLVKDGVLEEIDPAKVPNLRHVGPRFRDPPYDPGNRHSVPYQWGVTGIAYRKSEVKDPPRTWKDLFDPAKLAAWKGRVSMLDDVRELAAAALLSAGRSPNSRDAREIEEAGALLQKQKPFVGKYDSSDFGASLVKGEMLVAQAWNGDVARAQLEEPDIAFVVPEEGALSYVDNWAVPKGAKEKDAALAFADFLLRPEIAAEAVKARPYASVNESAKAMIDPKVLQGTAYADGGRKLHRLEDAGPAAELYAMLWADLKSK